MNTIIAKSNRVRWLTVAVFAIAMAWVESAVVYYLRTHMDRIVPYQPNPLPEIGGIAAVELPREFATLVMLFLVGALAGRNGRERVGYSLIAFGVWDIFYYVFLWLICGWPKSLLDWDVLFLIPLVWWGPVLAPVLISVLMISWGTLVSRRSEPVVPANWSVWFLSIGGSILALYVFMADSLRVAHNGLESIRTMLPIQFNWPLFLVALVLMSAPLIQEVKNCWQRPETPMAGLGAN
jgi:hypothetical protein